MSIIVGVGSPGTLSSASGGKTYAFNAILSASTTQVAPANPARKQITFINPSATRTIYVSMLVQLSQAGVQSALTPTTAALGGTIPVLPNTMVSISGECQLAWQALTDSGSTSPLTVIDTNA